MSTISCINANNNIIKILEYLGSCYDMANVDKSELQELTSCYDLGSISLIARYHMVSKNEEKECINLEFEQFMTCNDIPGKINNMLDTLSKLKLPPKAVHLINCINNLIISYDVKEDKYKVCLECDTEMVVRPEDSDQCCPICGYIDEFKGTLFEDLYHNDDRSTKHGPYKPSRHCEHWLMRIFAMEKTNIPQTLIDAINHCLERDGIRKKQLTPKMTRGYLKELAQTTFNSNVPKIRKLISGISPQPPTYEEYIKVCQIFDLADQIFMQIKSDNVSNRRYYPHFIRKSIELVYEDHESKMRTIVEGIHLQSRTTSESHDNLWREICEASEGKIKFLPTRS